MRTAWALQVNVVAFIERHGIDNVGFLTLTFAEFICVVWEAQRRKNSLVTNVIRPRYGEAIIVLERCASGRIHYHLLVAVGADIRTGFDFEAVKRRDYRSASKAIRDEWRFWRRMSKRYGFGRVELLPIRSTAECVGEYVGGYIAKHVELRDPRDKGARLVTYVGPRVANAKFAWARGRAVFWRRAMSSIVEELANAREIHEASVFGMRLKYGRSWCFKWREAIILRVAELQTSLCVDSERVARVETSSRENCDRETGEILCAPT